MQKVGHYKKISCNRSTIHGWGVFADERIEPADVIEMAPTILIPQSILGTAYFLLMTEGIPAADLVLDQYGLGWDSDRVCIPMGWVGVYNHSDDPSAEFIKNDEEQLIGIKCIKSILPGEEITVHYGHSWWSSKNYLQKA
jgi:SET domain-containing protein